MINKVNILGAILIGFFLITDAHAQSHIKDDYPILINHKKHDYPKTLTITGKIIDISFSKLLCGVSIFCGTIKVELTKKCRNYKGNIVYIVIPCLNKENGNIFLNNITRFKLTKIVSSNVHDLGCFPNIFNTFNTINIPFYFIKE